MLQISGRITWPFYIKYLSGYRIWQAGYTVVKTCGYPSNYVPVAGLQEKAIMSMFVSENNIIQWKDQKCTFYPCEKNDEAATPNIRLSDWPISGKISIRCIPSIDPCHPENLVSLCNRVLKIRITRRKIFQTLQFFWLFWETRGECVCGMCVDFPEVKSANQRPA